MQNPWTIKEKQEYSWLEPDDPGPSLGTTALPRFPKDTSHCLPGAGLLPSFWVAGKTGSMSLISQRGESPSEAGGSQLSVTQFGLNSLIKPQQGLDAGEP